MQNIELSQQPGKPYQSYWIVSFPDAHPHWDDYVIFLVDLTTDVGKPAELFKPGMTHQIDVWSVNPDKDVHNLELVNAIVERNLFSYLLSPQNHCYQFKAKDHSQAFQRIDELAKLIDSHQLSPDTDFRSYWNELFKDGAQAPGRN